MKMKKYLFLACLLVLTVTSCQKDNANERFMAYDEVSILTYLQGHPEYSLWYSLLERSGLAPAFHFSTTPITFFAMKNEVLQAYLEQKGYKNVQGMSAAEAKLLIQYHTLVRKSYELADFRDGKLVDSTASGDYLSCLLVSDAPVLGDNGVFINRLSKIVLWDIKTVNGVIHEISHVIDPVKNTLYDFLVQNSDKYGILREAYELTGDTALLKQLDRTDVPMKCRRTLFVTSDSSFKQQNIRSLTDLITHLGAGADYKNPENTLNQHLRYRILDMDYSTTEFAERLSYKNVQGHATVDAKGMTIATMAKNKLIQVGVSGIDYLFNGEYKFVGKQYNLQVKNGFVHEVAGVGNSGGVFDIFEPEQMITVIEPTDYLNFRRIPEYRNHPIQKTMVDMKAADYAPSVTWRSTPADKKMAVTYIVFTEGGYNFLSNGFRYGDCLFADLGPVGQVEIVTPPIPKGKYKILLYFKQVKVSGGIFQPYLDGVKTSKTASAYSGLGADAFPVIEVDDGTFTFEETVPHTFTLKVSSPGELHWDLLLFEPVK